jgi:hypothetical protein
MSLTTGHRRRVAYPDPILLWSADDLLVYQDSVLTGEWAVTYTRNDSSHGHRSR